MKERKLQAMKCQQLNLNLKLPCCDWLVAASQWIFREEMHLSGCILIPEILS